MKKYFILLMSAVSVFALFGFSINTDARKTDSKTVNLKPTPKNKISIQAVSLDKYEAELRCNNGMPFREGMVCAEDPSIKITTFVNNPKNSEITYYYTVSGGKIAGQGASVSWDFRGVRPGNYTVTVGIGNKTGVFGETITKTVLIRECGTCDLPCVCPTLTVLGKETVRASESVVFSAKVAGGSDTSGLTYKWTVSQGEIVKGQGTPVIKVKTTKEMNGTIEATVEIEGPGLCGGNCPIINTSETTTIVK